MKKFISTLLSVAMVSALTVTSVFATPVAGSNCTFKAAETNQEGVTEIEAEGTVTFTIGSKEKTVYQDTMGIRFDKTKFEVTKIVDGDDVDVSDEENSFFGFIIGKKQYLFSTPTVVGSNTEGKVGFALSSDSKRTYPEVETFAKVTFKAKADVTGDFDFVLYEDTNYEGLENVYTGDVDTITVKVKPAAPATVKVTDITLSTNEISAVEEATGKVTATVKPDNATTKGVNFKSNDTSVIEIDGDGNWTAKGAGTTTITVTPKEADSTVSKTINVTISAKPAPEAKLTAVKAAVSEDVANTGYWIYTLSNFTGDRTSYKLTFKDVTDDKKLEYDAGMNLSSEGDVTFALYLTAKTGLGNTFATSAQVGGLSANGAELTIGSAE